MTTQPEQPRRRLEIEMEIMPDGSALLFDPKTEEGHVLSALGALVWDLCDGQTTLPAIDAECAALYAQMRDGPAAVREIIASFADLGFLADDATRGPR